MRGDGLGWAAGLGMILAIGGPVSAQGDPDAGRLSEPERTESAGSPVQAVLEGLVLLPDGAPAEGAVVVSSAGGKAVVDARGSYRLELELPRDVERVQVTAVGAGGRNLAASTSVAAASGVAWVNPLTLAVGATCSPSWLPTFGGYTGTNGTVLALAVYDDGGGPALYAGGGFSSAGGVATIGVAKWNGSSWSSLGSGMNGGVFTLAVHDDGGGAALYAAGNFTSAGGVAASRVAKWNGSSWSSLGSGVHFDVWALAAYDAGGGAELYAGGGFSSAAIAKWNGSSWSPVGSGIYGHVRALVVHDDGGGAALYAGGDFFTTAGGVVTGRVARWDGSSWTELGAMNPRAVLALAVYDDGGGPALYAAGGFSSAGGVPASRVARWDGSSWAALGNGVNSNFVFALAVYDDGGGPALYAGGGFSGAGGVAASRVAKWNGSSWSSLGSGVNDDVWALAAYDAGGGAELYAGGVFAVQTGGNGIAKWDGASWSELGSGSGLNRPVRALAVYDDGGGRALYAGGDFWITDGVAASRIAKWDGTSWSALGSGVGGSSVLALAGYDDGSGAALYAGGIFPGGIARWNGTSWSYFGGGVSGQVYALALYDDGGGAALYAGGFFGTAGGVPARLVARWDGSSWAALGSGLYANSVFALAVYDDGSGPALYAGGSFQSAGGVQPKLIAKWDGTSWSALSGDLNGPISISYPHVRCLAVYDDGGGPALYVGGLFQTAGGVTVNGIAKWDGTS